MRRYIVKAENLSQEKTEEIKTGNDLHWPSGFVKIKNHHGRVEM